MEATQFGYSTKNIPIPSENDYKKTLIEKTEHLCKRMRWKAHFFLNPENKHDKKETYGFNSKKSPLHIPELASFNNELNNNNNELYYRITQITGKPVFYIVVQKYI
jgi:hypothetical protein